MSDFTVRADAGDITVHVHTEDGKIHTVRDSPQLTPQQMIRGLVEAHVIPGVDQRNRAIPWCLDDREVGKTLDDNKTLQENGVRNGYNLHARRRVTSDVTLHLHREDGSKQSVELSPQVKLGVMIQELVRAGIVVGIDEQGRPIEWRLEDREASKTLDNGRTLEENGVQSGHHLYFKRHVVKAPPEEAGVATVQPPPKLLTLQIQIEKGDAGSLEVEKEATTEELLAKIADAFGLARLDSAGRSLEWVLEDKDTGRTLTLERTLEEEGVSEGHLVEARQQRPAKRRPIPPLIPAVVGLALLGALGIWAWITLFISVEVRTTPAGAAVQINGKDRGISPLRVTLRKGTYQIGFVSQKCDQHSSGNGR